MAIELLCVPTNGPTPTPYSLTMIFRMCLDSAYYLGLVYFYGDGAVIDVALALHYFKIAAAAGHIDAMVAAAYMIQTGLRERSDSDSPVSATTAAAAAAAASTTPTTAAILVTLDGDFMASLPMALPAHYAAPPASNHSQGATAMRDAELAFALFARAAREGASGYGAFGAGEMLFRGEVYVGTADEGSDIDATMNAAFQVRSFVFAGIWVASSPRSFVFAGIWVVFPIVFFWGMESRSPTCSFPHFLASICFSISLSRTHVFV